MEQKIRELTEKLFQEGVRQGESEASRIISEAQAKAAGILSDARAQAETIISETQKEISKLKNQAVSDIKLSGTQAISAIRQRIVNLITAQIIDENVTSTMSDPSVIKDLIITIVSNWKNSTEIPGFEVLLSSDKQHELNSLLEKTISEHLKQSISFLFSDSIKAGFRIGPSGGSFKISITDEDFSEFIKEYLRPQTRRFLFGE
jgi:V/A-type H+-transporting ATPase subunit E